jgi:hypothetical protein
MTVSQLKRDRRIFQNALPCDESNIHWQSVFLDITLFVSIKFATRKKYGNIMLS